MTPRLSVGDTAPLFTLPDARGGDVTLDPSAAPATVVVFTANGCPYALAWHDRIQQVARDYAGQQVTVIQVVGNDETGHPEDSVASMRRRVENGDIAGPYLRDADQEVVAAYGATATPEVFVLDRQGVVRYHGAPDANHDNPAENAQWARDALDDVLAGKAVRRPRTSPVGCSTKWRVELLWWEGCPSHEGAFDLLSLTLAELKRADVAVVRREVITADEAVRLNFPGSPTFQVGRRDLFPHDAAPALNCRVYRTPDGRLSPLPDAADLAARLREALARPWDLPGWVDPRKETS
ncbi:MAG TPA: thioredoxin family protein [Streptosporangiaceae bacterium]|nr:thioredoxin family protein [Streptosporangiaceae bacterium]